MLNIFAHCYLFEDEQQLLIIQWMQSLLNLSKDKSRFGVKSGVLK